jgi:hypothetical protein
MTPAALPSACVHTVARGAQTYAESSGSKIAGMKDSHGNISLGGTGVLGDALAGMVKEKLGKIRIRADTCARSFACSLTLGYLLPQLCILHALHAASATPPPARVLGYLTPAPPARPCQTGSCSEASRLTPLRLTRARLRWSVVTPPPPLGSALPRPPHPVTQVPCPLAFTGCASVVRGLLAD